MNLQIILATQSIGSAAFEIVIMLLVAAIIGFITGYLLCKSKRRKLETPQAGMDALKSENIRLREERTSARKAYQKIIAEKGKAEPDVPKPQVELSKNENDLKKIAAKKHMLDYESFGTASVSEKDDLKMIKGIGPFIEKKLNAVDIYTFKQISRFTDKDINTVTESIEFFPGRIQRDQWVEQSKKLIK